MSIDHFIVSEVGHAQFASRHLSTNVPRQHTWKKDLMMNLDKITLEQLRLWTPEALKRFLSVRKKSVQGSFDELVAM